MNTVVAIGSDENPPCATPALSSGARELNAAEESRIFWRLRRRLLWNVFRQGLARSRLRITLVVTLTAVLWGGLYFLFVGGFTFLRTAISDPGTHDQTVRAVYSVFFVSLTFMLVVSTGVILYGSLYRAREVRLLLTTPARAERIFAYKFHEAMLFSSWGFVLLGTPMLVAYGVVEAASWHYFVLLLPFLVAFVFIPGSIGAVLCLCVARHLPRNRQQVRWTAGGLAALVIVLLAWSLATGVAGEVLTPQWFQTVVARLRFSENRFLPSWWLSSGLLEAARGRWSTNLGREALSESVLFFALTLSNALLWQVLAIWTASKLYRATYGEMQGERMRRSRGKPSQIDRALEATTFFLSREVRLLLVKDFRLFRRDPVQWSQFLIFLGLLSIYFLNTRRLSYDDTYAAWVNMISFLNLAVVGLILSTFTTRFIFPMISLEGRRFWILGLLPVRRETILWGKFLFAACGSLIPCTGLVLISDLMLRVPAEAVWVHLLACVLLCSGLSGIAVGLGAMMPNLREESPSKIAAGFGGTLNLVLSAMYIVAIVVLTAVPWHFYLGNLLDPDRELLWLSAGTGGSIALGIVATIVPLRLGFRAFRALEF